MAETVTATATTSAPVSVSVSAMVLAQQQQQELPVPSNSNNNQHNNAEPSQQQSHKLENESISSQTSIAPDAVLPVTSVSSATSDNNVSNNPNAEVIRGQMFEVGPRYKDLAYIGEGAYGMVV